MNKTILSLIIGNEFCERFCFYGLRSLLFVFLRTEYYFSTKNATRIVHLFVSLSYFFTLFGGLISDLVLGKFKTIIYLSLVYFTGTVLLTYTSIATDSPYLLLLSLLMISMGTGGIKPCVAAFGGDQFENPNDAELNSFFNFFYFAINVGSMMSMLWSPLLADVNCSKHGTCYPLAFGVSSILLGGSIILFVFGVDKYIKKEPNREIIMHILKHLRLRFSAGISKKWVLQKKEIAATPSHESKRSSFEEEQLHISMPAGTGKKISAAPIDDEKKILLNPAAIWQNTENKANHSETTKADLSAQEPTCCGDARQSENIPYPAKCAAITLVDRYDYGHDFENALEIIKSFAPVCFFWMLFDQQSTAWVEQGSKMNNNAFILGHGYEIIPSQMQAFNSIFILLFIPLFTKAIYPAVESLGLVLSPLQKISGGIFFGSFSFVISAVLEHKLQEQINLRQQPLSILWQLPQYLILTMGEIMLNMTGLEFAYSEAPISMKSVILAGWLLTVAIGNFFVIALSSVNILDWMYPKKADTSTFIVYSVLGFAAGFYMLSIERTKRNNNPV